MSDRDSVLQEFMAISGVGEEARAKFYLEAANWELSLALSGFFEGGDSQVCVCGERERERERVEPCDYRKKVEVCLRPFFDILEK